MNKDMDAVRRLLPRDQDPALALGDTDEESGPLLSARAERELAALRVLSSTSAETTATDPLPRPSRVFGRRRLLGLATVAAAGGAVVVVRDEIPSLTRLIPWGYDAVPTAAVTPPVLTLTPVDGDPAAYLRSFAQRVARLPEDPPVKAFQYSRQWGWWLNTASDVPGGTVNAAVPTVTETWVDREGGGRQLRTTGKPIFPDPEREDEAREAGLVAGRTTEDETYDPGGFFWQNPWRDLAPFARTARRLAAQLDKVNLEGGLLVYGIADLLTFEALSGPVAPRLRSAALELLADIPRVKVSTSRTWQGRDVVAVTQETHTQGSTSRNSVLLAPATGHVVGSEDAILDDPLSLNIRVPATLSVTEFLERGEVDGTTSRPER